MQQLTLQFDGFCEVAKTVNVPAAKERKPSLNAWLCQESRLFSHIAGESISRLNAICGTVAVVSSLVVISFAVIIGG